LAEAAFGAIPEAASGLEGKNQIFAASPSLPFNI
jgi:hypothetical protein